MVKSNYPIFLISVDRAGHINQCRALCELLDWTISGQILVPAANSTASFWARLHRNIQRFVVGLRNWFARAHPSPVVVVASGPASEALVRARRRALGNRLYAIYVGLPKKGCDIYNFVLVSNHAKATTPKHYYDSENLHWITGVLAPSLPISGVGAGLSGQVFVIGGTNKAYSITEEELIPMIREVAKPDATLVFSPRTPKALQLKLKDCLADVVSVYVEPNDRQSYARAIGSAETIYVTPDSISMLCEARKTGKPVYVLPMPSIDRNTSTARFVDEYIEKGFVGVLGETTKAREVPTSTDGIDEALESLRNHFSLWQDQLPAKSEF